MKRLPVLLFSLLVIASLQEVQGLLDSCQSDCKEKYHALKKKSKEVSCNWKQIYLWTWLDITCHCTNLALLFSNIHSFIHFLSFIIIVSNICKKVEDWTHEIGWRMNGWMDVKMNGRTDLWMIYIKVIVTLKCCLSLLSLQAIYACSIGCRIAHLDLLTSPLAANISDCKKC